MFLPFLLLLSAAAWSASAQQWVQHGQKLYHVGIGAGPMDWWQADRCSLELFCHIQM